MTRSSREAESIRTELTNLELRRVVLQGLLTGYEQLEQLGNHKRGSDNAPKGSVSIRKAILEVLQEAEGPLKTSEIWNRVQAKGAVTSGKNPPAVVDLTTYQLQKTGQPLVKVAPSTWEFQRPSVKRSSRRAAAKLTPRSA